MLTIDTIHPSVLPSHPSVLPSHPTARKDQEDPGPGNPLLNPSVQLRPHQAEALAAFGALLEPRGVIAWGTALGKTLLALACADASARRTPGMKLVVLVPTTSLQSQWCREAREHLRIPAHRIGRLGGGHHDSLQHHDVLIVVIRTAQRVNGTEGSVLAQLCREDPVFVIIDECHHIGAPGAMRIFDAQPVGMIGLSATVGRRADDALDENGQPLPTEQQAHVKAIGPVFTDIGVQEGRRRGLYPPYEIHVHRLWMSPEEDSVYEGYLDTIRSLRKRIRRLGANPNHYRHLKRRSDDVGRLARDLNTAYLGRKQALYKVQMRDHVTVELVAAALNGERPPRTIAVFHERTGADGSAGAERIYRALLAAIDDGRIPLDPSQVALEHSKLRSGQRLDAVERLRTGEVLLLVSAKALREGIDLPVLDMMITASSTSSPLQRRQDCGRCLRVDWIGGAPDPDAPTKTIHHLCVADTVDERIYRETDWGAEFGADSMQWWEWPLDATSPQRSDPIVAEPRWSAPTAHEPSPALVPVADGPEGAHDGVLDSLCRLVPSYAPRWRAMLATTPLEPLDQADPFSLTYIDAITAAIQAWQILDDRYVRTVQAELRRRATKRGLTRKGRLLSSLAAALEPLATRPDDQQRQAA